MECAECGAKEELGIFYHLPGCPLQNAWYALVWLPEEQEMSTRIIMNARQASELNAREAAQGITNLRWKKVGA